MRNLLAILTLLTLAMFPCGCSRGPDSPAVGMSMEQAADILGVPDLIEEHSGDRFRLYRSSQTPEYTWPLLDERTDYYLEQDIQVTFIDRKLTAYGPIDPEVRRDRIALALQLAESAAGEQTDGPP